jgi:hypothetical protein
MHVYLLVRTFDIHRNSKLLAFHHHFVLLNAFCRLRQVQESNLESENHIGR